MVIELGCFSVACSSLAKDVLVVFADEPFRFGVRDLSDSSGFWLHMEPEFVAWIAIVFDAVHVGFGYVHPSSVAE